MPVVRIQQQAMNNRLAVGLQRFYLFLSPLAEAESPFADNPRRLR
jgi:hypothetical protein